MKKLIAALSLIFMMSAPSFAQTTPLYSTSVRTNNVPGYSVDDMTKLGKYTKMARAQYEVDLRGLAIEALHLDKEQTEAFTPVFLDYMSDKKKLMQRRNDLIEEYRDEMAEDNDPDSQRDELADFIEDYMEYDIREMELRKDYFDILEDHIGVSNALSFFELEGMYADRLQRMALLKSLPTVPVIYLIEPVTYSYKPEMDAYNDWRKIHINGEVSLDHDYTFNGLEKLLTAAEKMSEAEGITVNNFHQRKQEIMKLASDLKTNWRDLSHANYAREAFIKTADILAEIARDSRFTVNQAQLNDLSSQARMLKGSVKLTDQGDVVDKFFSTAQSIVNNLVSQANNMTSK